MAKNVAAAGGNVAFIDGQNLHYSLRDEDWKIDYRKFRVYLREKHRVADAYYHFGFENAAHEAIYENLRSAGFTVAFQMPLSEAHGTYQKKGNVDSDLVFSVMRLLYKQPAGFDKIVLVSGDGDFYNMVRFLIEEERFGKILLPKRRVASSLYKRFRTKYYEILENEDIKLRIKYEKSGGKQKSEKGS